MNLNVPMLHAGCSHKKAVLRSPGIHYSRLSEIPGRLALRHKENLVGVGILHFRAGGESFNVNVLAR